MTTQQQPATNATILLSQLTKETVGYVHCPFCQRDAFTKTKQKFPLSTHAIALACCITFCIGCFAYCIDPLVDVVHSCSSCKAKLVICKGSNDRAVLPKETQQALMAMGQAPYPMQQNLYASHPQQPVPSAHQHHSHQPTQPPQWGHYPNQGAPHQQPVQSQYDGQPAQYQVPEQQPYEQQQQGQQQGQLQPQETGIMYREDVNPVAGRDEKQLHY